MSEMLTGLKKIVDGLTEVFRGLTRMCEGMAEQIELLELTSEDAEDEDKRLPPAKLPAVDTAPRYRMCLTLVRNRGSVLANRNRTLGPRWRRRPRSRPKKLRQKKA